MAGRPRGFDRDSALESAVLVFWEHGYDGTTIAQLSAALGIGAPSLYAAFGDKQTLFDEVTARYVASMMSTQGDAFADPDAREAVRQMLAGAADHFTTPGKPPGCLVMREPRLAEQRAAGHDALVDRLEQGSADGQIDPAADVADLAEYIDVVLMGLAGRARDGATREQLHRSVEQAMRAWPGTPSHSLAPA